MTAICVAAALLFAWLILQPAPAYVVQPIPAVTCDLLVPAAP